MGGKADYTRFFLFTEPNAFNGLQKFTSHYLEISSDQRKGSIRFALLFLFQKDCGFHATGDHLVLTQEGRKDKAGFHGNVY